MDERFMQDIPDELDESSEIMLDDEQVVSLKELHSRLKMKLEEMSRRRQRLFDQRGVVLKPEGFTDVRLQLLVKHGLGCDTLMRFHFELEWIEVLMQNMETADSAALAEKKRQSLIIPGDRRQTKVAQAVTGDEDDFEKRSSLQIPPRLQRKPPSVISAVMVCCIFSAILWAFIIPIFVFVTRHLWNWALR